MSTDEERERRKRQRNTVPGGFDLGRVWQLAKAFLLLLVFAEIWGWPMTYLRPSGRTRPLDLYIRDSWVVALAILVFFLICVATAWWRDRNYKPRD